MQGILWVLRAECGFTVEEEMIVCNLTPVSELQHLLKNVIIEHQTDIFDEGLK